MKTPMNQNYILHQARPVSTEYDVQGVRGGTSNLTKKSVVECFWTLIVHIFIAC